MLEINERRQPIEMLAEEFTRRLRAGEYPSVDDYVANYPAYAQEIRSLFPVIATLEEANARTRPQLAPMGGGAASAAISMVFGDYCLSREIGRGGMGVVYEAKQNSLDRRVAIKVLPANYLPSEKHVLRFKREAQSAARLHHTNIVPVFGVGEQDGSHYYVMQYIEGHSLDTVIAQLRDLTTLGEDMGNPPPDRNRAAADDDTSPGDPPSAADMAQLLVSSKLTTEPESSVRVAVERSGDTPLPDDDSDAGRGSPSRFTQYFMHAAGVRLESYYWRNIAGMGVQVARSLEHAHELGVLHRDIKPSNLMIDSAGKIWVTDFGLARIVGHQALTATHDTVGTLRYMAPEQIRGKFDTRTEIYNLGLTLYELITLQPAFPETDREHMLQRTNDLCPTRPRLINPQIPRDLETIVQRAISLDPDHRYQTAGALADEFRRFLTGRGIRSGRTSPFQSVWRWCKRNSAIARLASAVLVLLITVAVVATVGYVRTDSALSSVAAERQNAERARRTAEQRAAESGRRIEQLELQVRELRNGPILPAPRIPRDDEPAESE